MLWFKEKLMHYLVQYIKKKRAYKLIRKSGKFDVDFYLTSYADVRRSDVNPIKHYVWFGANEGRDPSKFFSSRHYQEKYLDVRQIDINPFYHYLKFGQIEGRSTSPSRLVQLGTTADQESKVAKKIMIGNSLTEISSDIIQDTYVYMREQNDKQVYQTHYVEFDHKDDSDSLIRTIAFYLPQFHPIPENDGAWGKGFTEWTNVTKALPQFEGHYQPRLPGELGYYDLRLLNVQERQIEIAKNYGIYGFCYHYYWFDGRKVMDKPLQQILDNPDLDFPFCINWANENWTKRWDGLENEVILKQNHSKQDDLDFIRELQPILSDPRYIRVNSKPLIMIYRPQNFPNIKESVKTWRKYARDNGIGELYLVLSHSFDEQDPREIGFDAATEFAPNNFKVERINNKLNFYAKKYTGNVFDYVSAIKHSLSQNNKDYVRFRSLCPSWDNEARKPENGNTFHNASPALYAKWLEYLCYFTKQHREQEERIVFINAWNEWAEGAHLEPDRKYGYAYLNATYEVLEKFSARKLQLIESTQQQKKQADIAVALHLYFFDLWPEIEQKLSKIEEPFDLYININNSASIDQINDVLKAFPNARLYSLENRGRDIYPFIQMLNDILPLDYKYLLKIHSKKSVHRIDGDRWRSHLINSLICSTARVKQCLDFLDNGAGIVVAKGNRLLLKDWLGSNEVFLKAFAKKIRFKYRDDFYFPAGSMFWAKPELFKPLVENLDQILFDIEQGQIDGTKAHALERVFGMLCNQVEKIIVEV